MDYKAYRASIGIDGKAMIETLHEAYPKYGKPTQCMIDNPDKYGVQLTPTAEKILFARFGTTRASGIKNRGAAVRRRKPCRLTVRLSAPMYAKVKPLMEANGFETEQDFLEYLIESYVQKEKA